MKKGAGNKVFHHYARANHIGNMKIDGVDLSSEEDIDNLILAWQTFIRFAYKIRASTVVHGLELGAI